MRLLQLSLWFWAWRHRPGLMLAARLADDAAWGNKNTQYLGPEQNLSRLAAHLRTLAGRGVQSTSDRNVK